MTFSIDVGTDCMYGGEGRGVRHKHSFDLRTIGVGCSYNGDTDPGLNSFYAENWTSASQSHISIKMACKQHLDSRYCFAIGSQHLWCGGSQPKHVSNPDSVIKKFKPHFIYDFFCFQALGYDEVEGWRPWTIDGRAEMGGCVKRDISDGGGRSGSGGSCNGGGDAVLVTAAVTVAIRNCDLLSLSLGW